MAPTLLLNALHRSRWMVDLCYAEAFERIERRLAPRPEQFGQWPLWRAPKSGFSPASGRRRNVFGGRHRGCVPNALERVTTMRPLTPQAVEFLDYCEADGGTPNTIKAYRSALRQMAALTRIHVEHFGPRECDAIFHAPWAARTRRTRISVLRQFHTWLRDHDYPYSSAAFVAPRPKAPRQPPNPFAPDEIARLRRCLTDYWKLAQCSVALHWWAMAGQIPTPNPNKNKYSPTSDLIDLEYIVLAVCCAGFSSNDKKALTRWEELKRVRTQDTWTSQ